MAARLAHATGVTLAVWNRSPDKAAAFVAEHGGRQARSPADAARGADVVFTCFPVSADVASILDGADGLLGGLARGAALVDCTSGDPATAKQIAARCAEHGIGYLDAPVSGGVKGAVEGALTMMIGGDAALLDRVRPVLEHCGKKIVLCGPVGSGSAVKAVNNALLAIHIWSAGEGLVTLAKCGVKPDVALDVINTSSGRSNSSMNLFPERVLTRAFPRTFRLALLDKDIGIAAGVAREQQVPTPLIQLTADLFRIAHNALGEEADHVEAVKVLELWAAQEIA
ncbi:MAG: 3-hydroxyisobutyrate dehydrogenase [Gemmatimonadetes bacterium]|nr:3-hydroxyisobutyrate dehydrogenase [Gemmatimonadota bacterium]